MYLARLGARRQIGFRLHSPRVAARLGALAGQRLAGVPHGDTVERYLRRVDPAQMQRIAQQMVRALLRARCLESFRLLGRYYLVTVDMSGHLYLGDSPSAFTQGCLTQQTQDGRTRYYRPVCEAKLVTNSGLALSIGSEFVENPVEAAGDGGTQDSELPAAARLFPRLKRAFRGYAICAVLDTRYANDTGFSLCEQNDWRYLITFKEGSLPGLWQEFEALLPLARANRLAVKQDAIRYEYAWVNSIACGRREVNVLQCRWSDPAQAGAEHLFVWVSDIPISAHNAHALAQEGGRQRWKIENEGFRTQKHGGFEMEHAYAKHPTSARNFYLALQVAHTLSQTLEVYMHGKAAVKRSFGCLRNLGHALLEALRHDPIPEEPHLGAFLNQAIQIRFRPARASPGLHPP